jgi:hypothetical protein
VKLECHDECRGRLRFGCGLRSLDLIATIFIRLFPRVQCRMYNNYHSFCLLAHHTSRCHVVGLGDPSSMSDSDRVH